MTREEIIAEMVRVAEALERPGLKPEQIIRGEKRYAELNALLDELTAREKAANDRPAQKYRRKILKRLKTAHRSRQTQPKNTLQRYGAHWAVGEKSEVVKCQRRGKGTTFIADRPLRYGRVLHHT